jgi:hypothetical protein
MQKQIEHFRSPVDVRASQIVKAIHSADSLVRQAESLKLSSPGSSTSTAQREFELLSKAYQLKQPHFPPWNLQLLPLISSLFQTSLVLEQYPPAMDYCIRLCEIYSILYAQPVTECKEPGITTTNAYSERFIDCWHEHAEEIRKKYEKPIEKEQIGLDAPLVRMKQPMDGSECSCFTHHPMLGLQLFTLGSLYHWFLSQPTHAPELRRVQSIRKRVCLDVLAHSQHILTITHGSNHNLVKGLQDLTEEIRILQY